MVIVLLTGSLNRRLKVFQKVRHSAGGEQAKIHRSLFSTRKSDAPQSNCNTAGTLLSCTKGWSRQRGNPACVHICH